MDKYVLTVAGLDTLLDVLKQRGFRVLGPTRRDQAIVYDEIDAVDDLPQGWRDEQDGGHYRLVKGDDEALFGYTLSPHSWKKYLHPPRQRLWQAKREGDEIRVTAEPLPTQTLAFVGVRACELKAMAIQDHVMCDGPYVDPHYQARREACFIVAVNCSQAAGTCFCVSMQAGPKADAGFDLALTEIVEPGEHRFVLEVGSPAGGDILAELPHRPAQAEDLAAADAVIAATSASMGRQMLTDGLQDLLMRNLEHPRWAEVAERCLSCGNCTMVCPTCFCTSDEDASDLSGTESSRTRRWDSCFTLDFSYLHGGSVRGSTRSRYRQWMTHKLATWHEQFDSSGCVGCGRCITWCPVGIDITEEVKAIQANGKQT